MPRKGAMFKALRRNIFHSNSNEEASRGHDQEAPALFTLQAHREKYKDTKMIDSQHGEHKDDTAMFHSLLHQGSFESNEVAPLQWQGKRKPGEEAIASLSSDLWEIIAGYLSPSNAASLALASKTILDRLGLKPWNDLNLPQNRRDKIIFLNFMDRYLPMHILCHPCAIYHIRSQPGRECIKAPEVLNPLFNCPNSQNPLLPAPRARITPRRKLPFTFVQLTLRAQIYSSDHGIPLSTITRRWKEDGWSHATRYCIYDGHLLLRVTSSCFATGGLPPSSQRNLLYSREDYTPYFSVCAHWKDGLLMDRCKCALEHIPKQKDTSGPVGLGFKLQHRLNNIPYNISGLTPQCSKCRPMRRCPECPTEYLIEVRFLEDKSDNSFKQAIVVTRWSDLGDKSMSREWKACNGEADYDSFAAIGKRAISGKFESYYTDDHIPGQRIMSLNPKKKKLDEEDDGWY
ncbi:hypothetical protein B7494_g5167 [Chlorociboria aeruginascens]|nr:hypothetical protein B7494_g5167 [Chlorociboria aeruginascens]